MAMLFMISFSARAQGVIITGDSTINQCEAKTYMISIQNNSGNPLTNLIITAKLANLTGFSYVNSTTSIDVNGGGTFCTANPTISGTNLIWDIDTQCGGPFTLNNLDTLNISFDLQTNCSAVSGTLNIRLDYEVGGTPLVDETGSHTIQVLPGGLTIKKTPNVIPQEIGLDVTWTLTIENTGFGTIKNVVVTDVLGAGLAYVSSTPGGVNSGQTTTWSPAEIAGFASMNPGEKITIDITATVMACENLENKADARWGCDMVTDCYNTAATVPPSTATASVERIVKTPLIQYTPPNVTFNYCDDFVDLNFTITNIGDGRAHDIWLIVDFGSLTVSNISAGAIYNNVDKRFELADPLQAAPGPGNTYELSFRLNYNTWCSGNFPTGSLLWQTAYNDDCDNTFYPPVELAAMNAPVNTPALTVGKSGAPTAVQIGSTFNYTIISSYTGPLTCGSGSTGNVTVVDTLPDGFTVLDAGGGIWVPGAGGTGGTITWTYTPPAALNVNLQVQAPGLAFCETYCHTTFTNNIQATMVDCCGCTLTDTSSQTSAIECEELVDVEKTAAPVPTIRCGFVQYTNTYIFADSAALNSVNLSQLIFDEAADQEQEYVAGSLQVTLSGSGDITACAQLGLIDTTPGVGGNLAIDFASCTTYGSVRNKTLTITYRLRITENTVGACSGLTFYSWSSLDFGLTTGSECLQDGKIYEAALVSVEPPAMSLSISGLDPIINKCQTQTITITMVQTSITANPHDMRFVLSGLNYYVVNPAATICSGDVAPISCTPALVGDDYVWFFADGFNGSGQRAMLQLTVQKRCTGGGELEATAYFDDNCKDDNTYDDSCSVNAIDTPALLLSGDLLIEKNPEVYYASFNTVEWKIYVTNRGSGSAYNVWIDDVLGAGLNFSSAVVSPDNGDVLVTVGQNHSGGAINGCTIAITEMTAGQRRVITLQGTLVNCNNLTNNVSTSWGCVGMECQPVVSDSSTVEIPRPLVINTNVVTTPADACTSPSGMITLKNAGQTTCYNLQVTETLPTGLLYVSGSTRWRLNGGSWNGPNAAYDPNPTVSPLKWTSTQIPGLATSDPGDTIEIDYDLTASCPFTGGDIIVTTSYENPCGQVYNTSDSVFTVAFRAPNITVTKTRTNEPIDCGELIEWSITIQNTSGYTLPIIWVEDTMDAAFTYNSSVGAPPYTSDNGTFDGVNKVSWELRNVANNDTVNLTLRATTDTVPCSPNLDNTVLAWWGCGLADGSSLTKPGVDPPDNNLCLTPNPTSTVRTETRQPTMSFMNIVLNPTTINSCDDSTELTVTIQNTGPTDASNMDLVVTFPPGLTYVANTSAVTCGGVLTDPAPEPAVVGNQLIYYDISNKANNLCNLVQANGASGGNDTVIVVFSVRSNCYATDNMGFRLYYYDCCGDTQYNTIDNETITSLYPSLTITKTPQNSQIDCGDNQTWTITVTNNGTGNAQVVRIEDTLGNWIDYISSAPAATAIPSAPSQVYGWEINDLAPGGSQVFTITGQLNPDVPRNNCSALLRQDNARAIWGCGTSGDAVDNNPNTINYDCTYATWTNATAATLAMPDLAVTAITPSITCSSDGVLNPSVTVTVLNQGDGAALSGFQVSVDNGSGWTGTGSYGGNLAAGGTATINIDVTGWNPSCPPCVYNFSAAVDTGDTVCECREDNNTFGPQPYAPAIPNLQVDNDTLAITCLSDGQYRISGTVTLRNAGCSGTLTQNVPMRFTINSGTGCSGAQVAQWTQTFTGVNIAAGSTQTFTITNFDIVGNACASASGCQFSIRTEADYTNTICECDGTDNTRCSNKTFTIPDLRVVSDTLAISCSVDGQIRIQGDLVVANDGCGNNLVTNIPIRISVYTNNADCSGVSGNLIFNQAGVNIPAGGTQTFAVNRTLNRNLCTNSTNCQVALGVELDYTNAICECNGMNNSYCSPNKVVSIPDLQVTGDTLDVACLQDGQVRVSGTATIANTGCNASVVGNLPVRFTLFSNINCGGVQLDQWTETFAGANIAAGGSQVFTITNRDIITNICTSSTGCQVSLRIEADPGAVICECNGGNNSRCANKALSVPDLRITAVTPSITCTADVNFTGTVLVTVNNNGCGAANNIPVRLTSDCGYTFTDQTVAALAAGASTNVTFTYTPTCPNCTCTFTAAIDPDNVICECDGTNNSLTSNPFSIDVPDVTVESDTLAVTCSSDGVAAVSGTITLGNHGCGSNLTANVPVRITLYDNTGCSGNQIDQWTETFDMVNIPAGGGSQSFTITAHDSVANLVANSNNCRVSLRIEADYTDSICECNGANNSYCTADKEVNIPDLQVVNDTLTVNCFNVGRISVSGTVTIANTGCGNNLNTDIPVQFTLYDNTGCGGNFINQWSETFSTVNIPAGGTQVFTITPRIIPTNIVSRATDCKISLFIRADYYNAICEADGNNNTRCSDKALDIPSIGLASEALAINCSIEGLATVSGTITLVNSGCGSNLTADIPMRFSIHRDNDFNCFGANLLTQWTETLTGVNIPANNGTQTFTITPFNFIANMCANYSSCLVPLRFEVNYSGVVCESASGDETLCTVKDVEIPDLTVNSVTPTSTCTNDSNFQGTVTVNVANTGCADATNAVVRLTSSCGYVFADQTVNLAVGTNANVVFTYTPSCSNCTCTFTATIDPDNDICECDGTNNTLTSAPYSINVPDVAVESDTLALTCSGDGQVTVSGTITLGNHGCGSTLTANVPVRLTLYSDSGCTGTQISQWTQTLTGVNIAPGGTQTFTITVQNINTNLAINSTNCRVSLNVEADYNDSICECDGTNNNYCADKNVDIPDIQVTGDTLAVTCAVDGQVTVSGTVTITNSGCGSNLTANIPVQFTLYDNTGCSSGGNTLSQRGNVLFQWTETLTGVDIPAGVTQVFTITGHTVTTNLVTNSTNCTISLRVEADYNDTICETDGTNNTYCADNKAVDIPDIVVQSEDTTITCIANGQFRISGTVTLQNNGCGPALTTDIPVQFSLYNNSRCSGSQVTQWTETLTGVNLAAGGGTQTFAISPHDVTANICANSTNCTVSLLIAADYTGAICESDGTNNTLCADKSIAIPNLTVNTVATSIGCISDGKLTGTTVNVSNNGCAGATGVVVRLTSDCGLTFDDQVVDLAAGESKDIFFLFLNSITTCNCTFTAVINPDNTICECDGTDNTRSSTTAMTIPDILVPAEALAVNCLNDGVIRVAGTVTLGNNGCGANFTGSVPMRFTLFSNTACTGNQVAQWTQTFTGAVIPPSGGTQTFTINPHDINTNFVTNSTNCMVSILIEADYNDTICEWSGTNNNLCVDKTSDCLDLEAGQLTVNTTCQPAVGVTGTFTLVVRNSGGKPVTHDFQIRIDDGEGWTSNKFYHADLGGPLPLAPGASYTVTINWTRNFTVKPYVCNFPNITALVDSQNNICESTAANNKASTSYQLIYPDLVINNFAAVCSGDGQKHLRLTVGNDGCGPINNDFNITFTQIPGQTQTVLFTSLGGKLPLQPGQSQTVILERWAFDCTTPNNEFTVTIDSSNQICEINDADNTSHFTRPATEPDLVMGNVDFTCHENGSITFVATVSNEGHGPAYDVQFIVYDPENKVIYTERIDLIKGEVKHITFTSGIYPKDQDIIFRFILDEEKTICECNGNNNENSIVVNCPSTIHPKIEIKKNCPPAANPGERIKFEIQVLNSGDADLTNVTIEDYLPERFQYVPGSSLLGGVAVSDPEPGTPLIWRIGDLNTSLSLTLTFSAVVSADIQPGAYCNEAQATAEVKENKPTENTEDTENPKIIITSGKVQCCTTISAGLECCLKIEETLLGPAGRPKSLISSYIEPYFPTEAAMFTVYAALNLWKDEPLEKETMPLFMKERLQNYARSTVEEFYLGSKLGFTLPDGSLWLSYAGAYPDQDDQARKKNEYHWLRHQVDHTMTASQVGFELLALNEIVKAENRDDVTGRLNAIIQKKLEFLAAFINDLPHGWTLNEKRNDKNDKEEQEGRFEPEPDVQTAIRDHVQKLDMKADLYDNAALYLAMVELNKSGFSVAGTYGEKLKELLKPIDNTAFNPDHLQAEFIFTLALVQSNQPGRTEQAKAKIQEFEKILPTEEHRRTQKQKEDKIVLNNIRDHALAAAVDYKAGGTVYNKLKNQLKEKYYLKDTGILADALPDFTFKLSLESMGPLLLSFDSKDPGEQEFNAAVLYRAFDEVGLFLKKRNIVMGNPLYSLLKNYPFSEPLLPVLPLTKAKNNIAPVFSRAAVIHSTQLKQVTQLDQLGEILLPQLYSKILSSGYETNTSRIASLSFGLQYFGRVLMKDSEPVNAEEGRSFDYTGKRYVDSLLYSGAGLQSQGITLLPYDTIAVKGPKQGDFNLEPLNAGTRFSTQTLADYLLAETYYIEGSGKYTDNVRDLMKFQARIIEKFKETGYIPETFAIYINNQSEEITVVPSKEHAAKLTIGKLFYLMSGDSLDDMNSMRQFLETELHQAKGVIKADDIIFFAAAPELVPYFNKEINDLVAIKDSKLADSAADVIGRQLLGEEPSKIKESRENLIKHWDDDAVLPVADRVDDIERGLIYRHEPNSFLLFLLGANTNSGIEKDFRFKRTLNFFTYLLENEWGVRDEDNNAPNRFLTLPSQEYDVVREHPRVNAEQGDILLFKVKVDNICPPGTGMGHDLSSLAIKASFTPPLIYGGSEKVEGLEPNGLFQWRYDNLLQGDSFEFIYQAYVPWDFSGNYIDGSISAYGFQGIEENGPGSGTGNKCEDTERIRRLDVVPLTELRGVVFEDRNVNGFKDVGEPGIPNILFKDTRGNYFRSDAEGRFTFFAGKDFEGVQMELKSIPANYLYIPSDLVSYHGPYDYRVITEPTRLVNSNYVGEIYFGLIPCKTVTGFVYIDKNNNNQYDDGEIRPAGVQLNAKDKQVITGKDGEFIFHNLPEMWQQWIKVSETQLFYKEDVEKLKIKINK